MQSDYEKEYGEQVTIAPKRSRGRPKKEGDEKEWDIRITPTDQVEVDFSSLNLDDFKILLVCKEGEPNGTPRLHYHIYCKTTRSDNYIDKLLNQLGKATDSIRGNAVFSKRKAHEGTIGYVVKDKNVVLRHGYDQKQITEFFEKSDNYRREKENERKKSSRAKENFLATIMKDAEVERLTDPYSLTTYILDRYSKEQIRFPPRSTIESAVMTILYKTDYRKVVEWYMPKFYSQD